MCLVVEVVYAVATYRSVHAYMDGIAGLSTTHVATKAFRVPMSMHRVDRHSVPYVLAAVGTTRCDVVGARIADGVPSLHDFGLQYAP